MARLSVKACGLWQGDFQLTNSVDGKAPPRLLFKSDFRIVFAYSPPFAAVMNVHLGLD